MKSLICISALVGICSFSASSSANVKYRSAFSLSSMSNGELTTYTVSNGKVNMPKGSVWVCSKFYGPMKAFYVGGFHCQSGNAEVIVQAMCAQGSEDSDIQSSTVSNPNGDNAVSFYARCHTRSQ